VNNVITGVHTLIYAEDAEAALGTHPSSWEYAGTTGGTDQAFDVSLMCDDLAATMAELSDRGAEFDGDVVEQGWGHTVRLKVPGAAGITLYEPTYDPPATSL
jgi:hypothetical protein